MSMSIKAKTKTLILRSVVTAIMLAVSVLMVIPFIWMLSTSFKNSVEVFNFPIEWIPKKFYFENYSQP